MSIAEFGEMTFPQFHTRWRNIPEIEKLFAGESGGAKPSGKEPTSDKTSHFQIPFLPQPEGVVTLGSIT